MKAILRVLVLLFLAVLLSGAPVRAQEPTPTLEPIETPVPTETPTATPTATHVYHVREFRGEMHLVIVDTWVGSNFFLDMSVVNGVAQKLSEQGEAGLVLACVPVNGIPDVCAGTYFALSTATEPVTMPEDIQMVSANGYR